MTVIIYLFLAVASVGFAGVTVIHISALLGPVALFQQFGKFIFPLFVIWIATIFRMNRLTRDVKRKDVWKGAPVVANAINPLQPR